MLPLSLLKTSQDQNILIELKTGETFNGTFVNCDNWMNLNLKNIILTSKDGEKFWKMETAYVRGNMIKYIRLPDEMVERHHEEKKDDKKKNFKSGRGGRGARGNSRGGPSNRGTRGGSRGDKK
eukprot:gene3214-5530_t